MYRFLRFLCLIVLIGGICGCTARQTIRATPVKTALVNGVGIAYREIGSGPPLLLIMGYAGTMDVWDNTMVSELAETRHVILFDNRGVGYSSSDQAAVSMASMAEDSVGLLDALHVTRADVMGWSMGSIIAQEMALAHPEKVGKLVLYGTATDPVPVKASLDVLNSLSKKDFVAQLFPEAWKADNPSAYAGLPSPAIPPSPESVKRQYAALMEWNGTRDRLANVKQETLVIVGKDDHVTSPKQALAVTGLIDNAWLVRFSGAGHWLMYQNGADLAKVIDLFLTTPTNLLSKK